MISRSENTDKTSLMKLLGCLVNADASMSMNIGSGILQREDPV